MKTYSVEIYRAGRHGHYGSIYKGLAVWTVEAKNKKEAREAALDSMIGKRAGDYDFPIDFSHAPEAVKETTTWGTVCYSMKWQEEQDHIINEWDIAQKNVFAIDVTEIKEEA